MAEKPSDPSSSHKGAGESATQRSFPQTQWPPLGRLQNAGSTERQGLYDSIIRRYWKPVYCFVLCRGHGEQRAEEWVQDFFAFCFTRNVFAKADPARGRFRSFLLTCLKNFIANRHRAEIRQFLPEGTVTIHDLARSDSRHLELVEHETPEKLFIRVWILELLLRVLRAFEQECRETGKEIHFEIFRLCIIAPVLDGANAPAHEELAVRFKLERTKQVSNLLTTARRAYQRLLREEIRQYAASEEEVAEEIQDIFRFFSGS